MMPDKQIQHREAERLLHGLSRLELPSAFEERLLSRLRNAQAVDAHRTRYGVLKLANSFGILAFVVIALFWRDQLPLITPQTRLITGRNPSAKPDYSPSASNSSSAVKGRKELSSLAPSRPDESRTTARLTLSRVRKIEPAQKIHPTQKGDVLRDPDSGALEDASGRVTAAENIGNAIAGTRGFEVPGSPLPRMRTAGVPGEPLPLFEIATAPGTPLPSFAETIRNGEY